MPPRASQVAGGMWVTEASKRYLVGFSISFRFNGSITKAFASIRVIRGQIRSLSNFRRRIASSGQSRVWRIDLGVNRGCELANGWQTDTTDAVVNQLTANHANLPE